MSSIGSIFHQAKWIVPRQFEELEPINIYHRENEPLSISLPEELKNLHITYKASLHMAQKLEGVTLRITADDCYKLRINGSFVCQGPAQGYYWNYRYNEVDITDYLTEGENELSCEVYYQGLINRAYNSGDRRLGLIFALFSKGEYLCGSDEATLSGIMNCYSMGNILGYGTVISENFDSRLTDAELCPSVVATVDYTFNPTPTKTVTVYTKLPEETTPLEKGCLYDFGEEITAGLNIVARGRAGDRVRILLGEELCDSPERVRYNMRCNCTCEELWTLADGENTLSQYDYKGFRYAAVIPLDGSELISVAAEVRHYPFDGDYCDLLTDNKELKAVWDICKRAVKYGCQEVYVDCPTREKGQYSGDMTVTSASQLVLTGDTTLLRKAIEDQLASARICKGLMAVTPGSHMQEIADYSLQLPIWALRYYSYTHDKAFLRETVAACEGVTEHFSRFDRGDGLLGAVTDKWNLVDWPANLRDGYDFPLTNPMSPDSGSHNVINAFYVGCVMGLEQMKDILGMTYEKKSQGLIEAFNREFYNPETGLYTDSKVSSHSSLHSNVIPLYYGISKGLNEAHIADFLMEKKLSCGVYMAYFLMKALCRIGRHEDALSLILSPEGWLNMVAEGATTCFEAWGKEQKYNTSLCHPWASAPISVLAEDILPKMPWVGKLTKN